MEQKNWISVSGLASKDAYIGGCEEIAAEGGVNLDTFRGLHMIRAALASQLAPRMLSVMRIVVAFVYMEHGAQKLFNIPPAAQPMHHLPPLMIVAGIIECFGGFLVLIGAFTRPVAFIVAGEMAVAYFMSHAPHGFWPLVNRGEPAVVYCFVFLYLAMAGGGVWSVDQWWRGNK